MRSWQNSLGVEQELAQQVELSAEGFYNVLDNLVSRGPDPEGVLALQQLRSWARVSAPRLCCVTSRRALLRLGGVHLVAFGAHLGRRGALASSSTSTKRTS